MKIFFLLITISLILFGSDTLKIATYNVENLFDLKKSGHEYKEYIPNSLSNWNEKNYKAKLKNLSKVIKDIDADIIALEEIESLEALKALRFELKKIGLYYQYFTIADAKDTTIKVALLSKIPFVAKTEVIVGYSYAFRNILEVKFKIGKEELYIFVNHWKSKSGPESERISYAKALKKRIKQLEGKNIILVGDFNSHYEEYITFKRKRKLNDTDGITGINHILGTINYKKDTDQNFEMRSDEFYNLWYDIKEDQRFSYIYKQQKEALDNILVNKTLLDNKGLEYKKDSIHSFAKTYLYNGKSINRWKMRKGKVLKHLGKGYSDHLPVVAEFTINTN